MSDDATWEQPNWSTLPPNSGWGPANSPDRLDFDPRPVPMPATHGQVAPKPAQQAGAEPAPSSPEPARPSPEPAPSSGEPAPPDPTSPATVDDATCPACGARIVGDESFCESCGNPLVPTLPPRQPTAAPEGSASTRPNPGRGAPARRCADCGGEVGTDGYCQTCGARAPSERDHFVEQPASWVAAVCDRGVRHERNEDGLAVAASAEQGTRCVLVVCDGVSTSTDSHLASLAAARRARDVLAANQATGMDTPQSRDAAMFASLTDAAAKAQATVLANTAADSDNAASCTFTAAVLEGGRIFHANLGDSRSYWFGDDGRNLQLTTDDSVAQARIAMGVPREEAESGYGAHAITRWLGRDAEEIVPTCGALDVPGPGWLLTCSDGLWNYASEPDALAAQLRAAIGPGISPSDPLPIARSLVTWANGQGGRDNISVALARVSPGLPDPDPPQAAPNLDQSPTPTPA